MVLENKKNTILNKIYKNIERFSCVIQLNNLKINLKSNWIYSNEKKMDKNRYTIWWATEIQRNKNNLKTQIIENFENLIFFYFNGKVHYF